MAGIFQRQKYPVTRYLDNEHKGLAKRLRENHTVNHKGIKAALWVVYLMEHIVDRRQSDTAMVELLLIRLPNHIIQCNNVLKTQTHYTT